MNETCPDLEVLFAQVGEGVGPALDHAKACPLCTAIIAEHRSLERELFHLSDPLPPSGFVPGVMAKIAAAPAPARREVWVGFAVLVASLSAGAGVFFARPSTVGHLGLSAAGAARTGVAFTGAAIEGLSTLWHHAALPLTLVLSALLMGSLYGLKRLAGAPALSSLRVAR